MDIIEFISERRVNKEYLLDCEDAESTRTSVSGILSVSIKDITKFLRKFDLEESLRISNLSPDYQGHILLSNLLKLSNNQWGYSHTAWFHYTRCQKPDNYSQGLLSLPDNIENIWELLFKLSSQNESEWNIFRNKIETENETYRIRTQTQSQFGPDGFLIGDEHFNRQLGHDHFFECPEIIRLIFREYGCSLKKFFEITTPCIMKFKTNTSAVENLARALTYLYELEQPNPYFTHYQTNCYLGHGNSIPARDIIDVKMLKKTKHNHKD